ncbi:hypothetical protein LA66_02685 [Aureimonas altamirensis]|uniref:Uncharacterized protein n=1 Tax=Aureimonas altamirensis TaxID=370622 RepID=A0A0B1Q9R1_9HYPH|nr:hypothetical protein LA66_02685 [Aureimonas altamirensis]
MPVAGRTLVEEGPGTTTTRFLHRISSFLPKVGAAPRIDLHNPAVFIIGNKIIIGHRLRLVDRLEGP